MAGGDTASALAAGNPVVVKAHPAHPGTSERVERVVVAAARRCGMPEGTFSLLFDDGFTVGRGLVQHPLVRAVGFTGSQSGGEALARLAAQRRVPFPATSDGASTSVGTRTIQRFTRLLAYQDAPPSAPPENLRDEKPQRIWRLLDGCLTREAVGR